MKKEILENWRGSFLKKVKKIISENQLSRGETLEFFLYENLKEKESDFCPLFKQNKICHNDIPKERFCCLFCACPNFSPKSVFGGGAGKCALKENKGKRLENGYWDCSGCSVYHDIDALRDEALKQPENFSTLRLWDNE